MLAEAQQLRLSNALIRFQATQREKHAAPNRDRLRSAAKPIPKSES
jgi:hypothetical protein